MNFIRVYRFQFTCFDISMNTLAETIRHEYNFYSMLQFTILNQ